jgi:hypothetical protein
LKRPNKKSSKDIKRDEYKQLRKEFLKKNPYCQARIPGCNRVSTDVHHKGGRVGDNLTSHFLSVCRYCHNWIETHPIAAKELGFSISRLNKDEQDI